MKVWMCFDGDQDCTWINAVYRSEALAKQHIAAMNEGWIVGQEVLAQLHEDVTDPVKRAARAEQKREWRAIQRQINAYR